MTGDPILGALMVYATIGLFVAIVFLAVAIDRLDEAAHGAYAFRPLLVPGLVLLWPAVLVRWAVLDTRRRGRAS